MIGGEEDFYFSCVLKEEEWCLYNNHNKTKETPYFLGQMNPILGIGNQHVHVPGCILISNHTKIPTFWIFSNFSDILIPIPRCCG